MNDGGSSARPVAVATDQAPPDTQHSALSTQHSSAIWSAHDEVVLAELDDLVRDTYALWDEEWVGFSWRNYTYDHVQRVRRLAVNFAGEEGADRRVVELAGMLHDITKAYDGEVLMHDGKRVLDEHGFWRNEFLAPKRPNKITALFEELGLEGALHNVSGARIADALLAEYGYDAGLRAHVGEVITSHLKVTDQSSLEGRCLYDADTIDANIGHPALYRNIQISMHFLEREHAAHGESTDDLLAANLRTYVHQYVFEKWPGWVVGKNRDFVERMTTEAGRRRATARIARLQGTLAEMQAEMDEFEGAIAAGQLAPTVYFMHSRRNPSLLEEMALLEERWPANSHHAAARFLETLRRESSGEL